MSEITAVIDRLRRDIEQIENGQATTLREKGHQIGRIVTAFQGILEEFTTSVTHLQKELENACETAKVKQIQLFTSLLDLQASIEYKFAAPLGSGAGHSRHGGTAAAGTHTAVFDGDRLDRLRRQQAAAEARPDCNRGTLSSVFSGEGVLRRLQCVHGRRSRRPCASPAQASLCSCHAPFHFWSAGMAARLSSRFSMIALASMARARSARQASNPWRASARFA